MLDYIDAAREKEARKHEAENDRLNKGNRELTEEVKRLIRAPQGSLALSEVERRQKVLRDELAKEHERREMAAREEKIDLLNRMAQKKALMDALMAQKDKENQEIIEKKDALMAHKDKDYQQIIEKKEVRALQENRHNQNRLDGAAAFHLQLAYSNQAQVHETASVFHDFLTTNQ
ncbi:hypothetical protein JG688_00018077 [Phytophthora aleatoria]|uniref:Uncharacterized protein n=1 Tax=Phytophthora aleatoria TaxID=2496075 RepID=A0A8J5MBR5_9STRA|nr:hypothetical protein JG688_00018077 [Phytophthora aleatoria]